MQREASQILLLAWRAILRSVPLAVLPAIVFVLVAVLDRSPSISRWNDAVSIVAQGPEETPLTVVGFFTDWLFSAQIMLGVAALVCLVLAIRRRWSIALSLATIFPLVVVEAVLKVIIHAPPASRFLQIRTLLPSGLNVEAIEHGFPSGHSARIGFLFGWIALLLVPQRHRGTALVSAAVLALFAAWTRVYVGDHSVLEVVAGLLLAVVFLPAAWMLAKLLPAR